MHGGTQLGPRFAILFDRSEYVSYQPSGRQDVREGKLTIDNKNIMVAGKVPHAASVVFEVSNVVLDQAASSGVLAHDDEVRSGLLDFLEVQLAQNLGTLVSRDDYRGPIVENVIDVVDRGYRRAPRLACVAADSDSTARTYRFTLNWYDPSARDPLAHCPPLPMLRDGLFRICLQAAGELVSSTVRLAANTAVTLRAWVQSVIPGRAMFQIPPFVTWRRYTQSTASERVILETFANKGKRTGVRDGAWCSAMFWLSSLYGLGDNGTNHDYGITFDDLDEIAIPFRGVDHTVYPQDHLADFLDGLERRVGPVGSNGATAVEDMHRWPYAEGSGPTDGVLLTDKLLAYPIFGSGEGHTRERYQWFSGQTGEEPSWQIVLADNTTAYGWITVAKEVAAYTDDHVAKIAEHCGLSQSDRARLRHMNARGNVFDMGSPDGLGHPLRVIRG